MPGSRGKRIVALAVSNNHIDNEVIQESTNNYSGDIVDEPVYAVLQPVSIIDEPSTSTQHLLPYSAICSDDSVKDTDFAVENDNNSIAMLQAVSVDELSMSNQRYLSHNNSHIDSDDSLKDPDFIVENEDNSESDHDKGDMELIEDVNIQEQSSESTIQYTKTGAVRKRRRFDEPLEVRKLKKLDNRKLKHSLKPPCVNCKKNCSASFRNEQRININAEYWRMTFTEKRSFVANSITAEDVKRHRGSANSRRQKSYKYFLKSIAGTKVEVCKTFFLTTLGYNKGNDRIVQDCFSQRKNAISFEHSKQGNHQKTPKIDRGMIRAHVESFNPVISHYRREHAPNKRYIPSDITLKFMHCDFLQKYNVTCSYEVYRKTVSKEMNISFTRLGHEECETCETFLIHNPQHNKTNICDNCEICTSWNEHMIKAKESRIAYKTDRESTEPNTVYFSADLEKVIMIPRIDMFKRVIFCPRVIVFNQCFVPLGGTKHGKLKPIAILWHEAISGRKKDDILSTIYQFLLQMRDAETIVMWVDNCASQNKNWTLLSFLTYIINSSEISAKKIILKYFEPGHSFMSADNFHHQVELSMKRTPKIYDFKDFANAVQAANSGKVNVLRLNDFYQFEDCSSVYKLNKQQPRPYLKDMVEITATRGEHTLTYRTSFAADSEYIPLNFLKSKEAKYGVKFPMNKKPVRGVTQERKNAILTQLSSIMPENRLQFWNSLPVNDSILANVDDD